MSNSILIFLRLHVYLFTLCIILHGCGYQWSHHSTHLSRTDVRMINQTSHPGLSSLFYKILSQKWTKTHAQGCPPPLHFSITQSKSLPLGDHEMISSFQTLTLYFTPFDSASSTLLQPPLSFSTPQLTHQTHPSFFPTSPSQIPQSVLPSLVDQFLLVCSSILIPQSKSN